MPFASVVRPRFFLTRRVGTASAEDMSETLERIRAHFAAASAPCALLYDAGRDPNGRPDAHARRASAAWFGDNEALLARKCAGMDFAFENPLSRGVLTAILWLRSPPVEVKVHGTVRDALASSLRRVGEPEPVAALLRELDDAERALRSALPHLDAR